MPLCHGTSQAIVMIRVPGVDTDNCAWMFGSDSSSWPQHRPNTKRSTMNITWHHFYIIFIYICIFFERCADCATQSKDPWSFTRCFFKQYHSLLVVKKMKHEYAWIHWWSCSTWLALTVGSSQDARSYNSNGRFAAMGREAWTWPLPSRLLCFWQLLGMILSTKL